MSPNSSIERRDCADFPDCNFNGIVDADDIASGRSLDVNGNNVPDECIPLTKFKRQGPPGTAPGVQVP